MFRKQGVTIFFVTFHGCPCGDMMEPFVLPRQLLYLVVTLIADKDKLKDGGYEKLIWY